MAFPPNDNEFTERHIDSVEQQSDGTYAITCDGWSLWCGKDCPVVPKPGQIARQYGRGMGSPVRGLFIAGTQAWYRTEIEEKERREIQMYGADAEDWLARWDRGDTVWTIQMGRIGPGYEQCIHITCAEILRWFIEHNADASLWDDKEIAKPIFSRMENATSKAHSVKRLGLSGSQWGAAANLAAMIYRQGPRAAMSDERVKDRHIQVCRNFPS